MSKNGKKQDPITVLFQFVGEDRGKMPAAIVLAVLGEVFGMIPYLSAAMLAGEVFGGAASLSRALMWTGIAVAASILKTILHICSSGRSHRISYTILKNIRKALADKMMRVPMGVMLETPSGVYKALIIDNVAKLEDSVAHLIPELPAQFAVPVAGIVLLFGLDYRMGLASLVTVPLMIPFVFGMMHGFKEKMGSYIRTGNEMNAALVEYVEGIQVIKAFGKSGVSFGKFAETVNSFHDSTLAWWQQSWFWTALVKAIGPSTMLGGLPMGAWLFMQAEISLPVFVAGLVIPIGIIGPLLRVFGSAEQIQTIASNLEPIQAFLETPEQQRPEQEVALADCGYQFQQVAFSYNAGKEVLHDISFAVPPGTMTAIVGPSGSGKSTIAKLMAGFWDAGSGRITFGGADIGAIPFRQLIGEISYVAQDNFLFDKSLRENIRMGKPGASDQEVIAAARAANCHEFITALPRGYDTAAGDAGKLLSGGERQRITIARAMLKPSRVIILDEATAYADPENEAQIQEALSRMVTGKTLIVVAHRLSTIQNADQIIVVERGRIVDRGTQQELLGRCRLYQQLWQQHMAANDAGGEA